MLIKNLFSLFGGSYQTGRSDDASPDVIEEKESKVIIPEKFKDDIEEFHESMAGMNVTLSCEINDETGILAELLGIISACNANILTIHQSIPISGVADLSISLQIKDNTDSISQMIRKIEEMEGVRRIRIMGREKQ